MSETVECLMQH